MDKARLDQATDLKMLVSHTASVEVSATIDAVIELSKQSPAHYFAVIDQGLPVGMICRHDEPSDAASTQGSSLWKRMTGKKQADETSKMVRDLMIPDPLIIEYGTASDVMFDAFFDRADSRVPEDIILVNEDGTFFGVITAVAVSRLLHGFLGKHMKKLRVQKETISFEHSQVLKVRRALELTNEKLAFSRDQALEGVRMKSEFLANMSHEIRTPMNGVFGMIDLLYDTELDHDQEQLVGTARSSAETLMRIIDDILEFSKMEAGKISIEEMPFCLTEIVEASAALYSEVASEKGLDLIVNFEDAPSWVVGDPHRYQQVLNNLISNALKFTDDGSVEVYLTAVQSPTGSGILTEVRDSGIGIPSSESAQLFAPFTQADGSHARKYGGTGLGLSICKNMVGLLGGEMDFDSEVGKGSTFSFIVPFSPYTEEGENASKPVNQRMQCNRKIGSARHDFGGMRVLLVEDNLVNQEVARRILIKLNCQVCSAENGQSALEYLKAGSFDCVFMDCQMPVLDGFETTRKVRQGIAGELSRDVFISAMTAHALSGDREKCMKIGMDYYFSKPFGIVDFSRALELATKKANAKFES